MAGAQGNVYTSGTSSGILVRMILTHHDAACIKAVAGDTTILFSPISKTSKRFKATNFGADVVFISLNDADMNGADTASRGDKAPFVISGPGEYEIQGITTAGFPSKSTYSGKELINTIYTLHFDGMSIMYMGAHEGTTLPQEVLEMDSPDVLIIPIGGEGTLTPAEAHKIAVRLEAKIVVPILYTEVSLKTFLKEASSEDVQAVDKFTVKPKDLAGKEGEVVVLSQ